MKVMMAFMGGELYTFTKRTWRAIISIAGSSNVLFFLFIKILCSGGMRINSVVVLESNVFKQIVETVYR